MAVNRYKIMKWQDLPKEIQEKMLERQFEQTGKRDVSVFEKDLHSGVDQEGMSWNKTPEGSLFWCEILIDDNISHFYTIHPKKESPYPKVMMVSDFPFLNGNTGVPRVVFYEKSGVFFSWAGAKSIEEAEKVIDTCIWKYAKDIEPIPSYTMEELFEKLGEKFTIKE